jgi:hypothetical protein
MNLLRRNYFKYDPDMNMADLKNAEAFAPMRGGSTNLPSQAKERTKKRVNTVRNTLEEKELLARVAAAIRHEQFQCADQLKTVMLLTKRYSAVGQLENLADFWEVLNARAYLHMTKREGGNAAQMHCNKGRHESLVGQEAGFLRLLFCDIVLWNSAGLMAERDLKCLNKN